MVGCMHGRGTCMGGKCGRRNSHCMRRYASYWNAFLLRKTTTETYALKLSGGRLMILKREDARKE